jgi:hypothetical protein
MTASWIGASATRPARAPPLHLCPTLQRYLAASSRTWRAYNARCQRAQADVTGLADDVRDRPRADARFDRLGVRPRLPLSLARQPRRARRSGRRSRLRFRLTAEVGGDSAGSAAFHGGCCTKGSKKLRNLSGGRRIAIRALARASVPFACDFRPLPAWIVPSQIDAPDPRVVFATASVARGGLPRGA